MGLVEYKRKRHFTETPEPRGVQKTVSGSQYVIQKHDASHLHYDFRLELDGVLKSWAVPKGPSLDPSTKRLAVQVEDHPVAYGGFEGIIPAGQYGGGTVLLWDTGTWEPIGDAEAGLRAGKLKFILHGEKLRGGWTLVRTRSSKSSDKPQWLLIKEHDDEADSDQDIVAEQPLSVASGRDLGGIASSKDRVWESKGKKGEANATAASPIVKATRRKVAKAKETAAAARTSGIKQPMPKKTDVQLATLTEKPPEGDEWLHEIKFDGYRMICRIDNGKITFTSRNQLDWTDRLSALVKATGRIKAKQAILDGEVVIVQPDGTTDFQSLQNAFREGSSDAMKYIVFDILYLDGHSLTELPLEERKELLQTLLKESGTNKAIQFSEHVDGRGDEFKQQACRLHLEGMVCKRRDQPYRPGRSYDWLKVKCTHKDEFVIGGYTDPSGSRSGFGALLVGYHDEQGELHYAGKVGTGFNEHVLEELSDRLEKLERTKSPFVDLTEKKGDVRTAHWIKPELVGQFSYGSRTREGRLRHASFQGVREDKPAEDVTLDQPTPIATATKRAGKSATAKKETAKSKRAPASKKTKAGAAKAAPTDTDTFEGVRLTHPEKVLYPEDKITKLELAEYYRDIADWLLPHLVHRPVVLVRCPDGQGKETFYQKHPGVGSPTNLRQIPIKEKQKTGNYLLVDDAPGLISLAQVSALELHAWGSREDKLELPDRLIFDLDPAPDVPWGQVIDSAKQVKQFLEELGLRSFVKTTGGKGLHLVVPIERRHDWDEAKAFCKQVAESIETAAPTRFTSNMSKAARPKRIFLDYLRNGRGSTAVIPYSPRARTGAPVSTPLAWDELSEKMHSDHFTIRNVMRRLASIKQDPWRELSTTRQSLTPAIKKLKSLTNG
jgi:bifunctional non-homologous end joining protein LigD